MAHVIQLALGAFMSTVGVKGCTKSWEAHECNPQFGENQSTDIRKCQRLRKEGNGRINKVSAMRPGLAKIIENVHVSTYFETAETDFHKTGNACCIDYSDTWLSKRVHWLWKGQGPYHCSTHNGCGDTLQFDSGVAQARLPITWIHTRVAQKPKIQWLLATLHNTGWVDNCQVCHRGFMAIPVLDPVHVETAYRYSALHPHCLPWNVWSHGWRDASFFKKKTQWKDALYFAVKFAQQKLSKCYTEVIPTTGMLLISAHILDCFRKLWWFRKLYVGMDINSEDETSYTAQYQEAFLRYVENEYCTKHRCLPVIKPKNIPNTNLISSTMYSRSGQSSFDPYDLSSDDDKYLIPNTVAETTSGQSDRAARLLTATMLY